MIADRTQGWKPCGFSAALIWNGINARAAQRRKTTNFLYKFSLHGVYVVKTVTDERHITACERLYEAKAAQLILYGRALGLSHAEAEDVVQETFVALMQLPDLPEKLEHYAMRSFRNRAMNYRRSLWRRLTREIESQRWFEKSTSESPAERAAVQSL